MTAIPCSVAQISSSGFRAAPVQLIWPIALRAERTAGLFRAVLNSFENHGEYKNKAFTPSLTIARSSSPLKSDFEVWIRQ